MGALNVAMGRRREGGKKKRQARPSPDDRGATVIAQI